MKYYIMGEYKGEQEQIDQAETLRAARYLRAEYQLAFGLEWKIFIVDENNTRVSFL